MLDFRVNRAKEKLAAGEVVSLVMGDYSADTAELLASNGVDVLWGEMEDGTTSWKDIEAPFHRPFRTRYNIEVPSHCVAG